MSKQTIPAENRAVTAPRSTGPSQAAPRPPEFIDYKPLDYKTSPGKMGEIGRTK